MTQFLTRISAAMGLLLAILVATIASAQTASSAMDPDGDGVPGAAPYATAALISERAAAMPGDSFMAALKLDLDPGGWHVYWKNPGDSGLPPEIEWTLPEGVQVGEFVWPAPHYVPLAGLANYGYKDDLVLPFQVTLPAALAASGSLQISGEATWLICLETCIPESAPVTLTLPIESAPREDATSGALIAGALKSTPEPLGGQAAVSRAGDVFRLAINDADVLASSAVAKTARFFPDGPDLAHAADQDVRRSETGVLIALAASEYASKSPSPLTGVLVVEAKDGSRRAWTIDAQPGDVPEIAGARIGGAGGGLFAGNGSGAPLAGAGLLAILGAAFLGGLVLNLMPCVLPVLSIKAASLARTAHHPNEARLHGLAYLGGVLVCFAVIGGILVALRSLGVQAGLGFQLQYAPVVAFFALAMFAIGLNLLGVFEIGGSLQGVGSGLAERGGVTGAFFTGMLAAFVGAPCVGPFMAPAVGVALTQPAPVVIGVFLMIGLGLAAPLLLLSFTPALAKLLPKPGAWMNTFRQVLAFPMFLTAIWLLWVLAGQAGSDAVILTIGAATVLGFGIWLATRVGKGWIGRGVSALVILAAVVAASYGSGAIARPSADLASASFSSEGKSVATEPWSPERVAALQAEKRVVFVDFTARWCVTCQVNERGALASAQVQKAFGEHNVAMLIGDWTNRDDVIAAELARHGRAGVPLYLVYPADGGEPEILPQLLSPSVVVKAIEAAAGAASGGA